MSKKNKKGAYVPKSPLKILLPVIIGLFVAAITCTVIVLATRPANSAKVENPNEVYLQIGNHKVSKQQMYEALRKTGGISTFTYLMDADLLKNVEVTEEDIEEARYDAVYGDEIKSLEEELAELKEKAEAETDVDVKAELEDEISELEDKIAEKKEEAEHLFEFNFNALGYTTEESRKAYFTVLAKRNVYAKDAYNKEIAEKDYTDAEYIAAYKALESGLYENSSYVIAVIFQNDKQANAFLDSLSKPVEEPKSSAGWKFLNDKHEIAELTQANKDLESEIKDLEKQLADLTDETEKAAKQAEITEKENQVKANSEKLEKLSGPTDMTDADVALAFIELYNLVNVYYLGGDVSEYFEKDEETGAYIALKDGYKLIKENVHYEVKVTEDAEGKEVREVVFNHEELVKLSEENTFCKFVYTDAEAKSILSADVYDKLVATADKEEGSEKATVNYTYTATTAGSKLKYLAYKYGSSKALEKTKYEELVQAIKDTTDETLKAEKQKELDDIKASLRPDMIEEKFNDNEQTRLLVELRQSKGLKIYDRYLNASYEAAYVSLYESVLSKKEGEYAKYEGNAGAHKSLAFSYKNANDELVEYTAEELFAELEKLYVSHAAQNYILNYALLSNEDYNKIYNPYNKKVYDRDAYKALLSSNYTNIYMELIQISDINGAQLSSVQAYKYAFELGLYSGYGYDAEYSWKNFLKDYLLVENEKQLAGQVATKYVLSELQLANTTNEMVLEEMQKIYDAYYSMKVANVLVTVDYNNDGTPDTYTVDGDQVNWTEEQIALAKELSAKIYEYSQELEGTTIEKKLTAGVDSYKNAAFDDAVWGKYIAAGLRLTAESATSYTQASSLVQEFHDAMASLYKEIEAAEGYKFGSWTTDEKNAGYIDSNIFASEFGFHHVTIVDASERVYINEDKSLDLSKLTIEMYRSYVEGEEEFDETETKAITTYLEAAISKALEADEVSLLELALCEELVKENEVSFKNESALETYKKYANSYKTYIEEQLEESEEE